MNGFKILYVALVVSLFMSVACSPIVEEYDSKIVEVDVQPEDSSADAGGDKEKDKGKVDEPKQATPAVVYEDLDGDGQTGLLDCDDNDPSVFKGAKEVCNNVDDNCDSQTDEGLTFTVYGDADKDGFGWELDSKTLCVGADVPKGYVVKSGDCNDSAADVNSDGKVDGFMTNPSIAETCGDKVDNDCDGKTDEGDTYYVDSDGDGYGDPLQPVYVCGEKTAGLLVKDNTDCHDSNYDIYPGAPELCDGKDNNCNGKYDEPFYNVGEPCQPESGEKNGVYICSENMMTEWCEPTPESDSGSAGNGSVPAPDDVTQTVDGFVPFFELAATFSSSVPSSTISYQVYSDAKDLGKPWEAEKKSGSSDSYVAIEVKGLTLGVCGIRFSVAFGSPATSWLCEGGKIMAGTQLSVSYFNKADTAPKVMFTESDAVIWQDPKGGCSVLFVNHTSGKCALK